MIVSELQAHYYKPVDAARLEQAGVKATLTSLHDPYTVYLTAQQSQALTQSLSGTYSGIGAEFVKRGHDLVITARLRRLAGRRRPASPPATTSSPSTASP